MAERDSVIAHDLRDTSAPDRNLALELVRVTEAAALAAARWVGRGDKEEADQAAVDAMRFTLQAVPMDGVVVIGEGEKDKAPMLYNGEQIGDGSPPEVDVAVDPLEGTRLTAKGQPSALAVVALSERGSMFDPGPCVYMEKIAGGSAVADLLDLDRPLEQTLRLIGQRKGSEMSDLTVIMLDRERHADAVAAIRNAGARIRFITDGDVSAALHGRHARDRVSICSGGSAEHPRGCFRRRRSSRWAARCSDGSGHVTTTNGVARPRPATT